jgi:hypothetical protein
LPEKLTVMRINRLIAAVFIVTIQERGVLVE